MTDPIEEFRTPRTISTVLLEGLYDVGSSFHLLLGFPHVMQIIWKYVKSFWAEEMINLPHPYIILDYAEEIKKWDGTEGCDLDIREDNPQPFYIGPIYTWPTSINTNYSFPPPSDINIKMMPFLAAQTFDQSKLPRYLRPYWDMIWLCLRQEMARDKWEFWPRDKMPSEIGKVYYLTILENEVEPGYSQGRPGLRVESEGIVKVKNEDPIIAFEGKGSANPYVGSAFGQTCAHTSRSSTDMDNTDYVIKGGIYLATSMESSYRVWDCGLQPEAVYRLGDVEHMRKFLPRSEVDLKAGNIYWMTDRTPYESLSLPEGGIGQFFSVVTSQVSLWYQDHYTPNPMGVLPDSSITKIVSGDRFSEEELEVVHVSTMMKIRNKLRRLRHLPIKAEAAKEYWDNVHIFYDSD